RGNHSRSRRRFCTSQSSEFRSSSTMPRPLVLSCCVFNNLGRQLALLANLIPIRHAQYCGQRLAEEKQSSAISIEMAIPGNFVALNKKESFMNRLKGKVAVVTGASKGIGAAIAEHLAPAGASVVVNYASSKSGADAVVKRITQKEGKAVAVQADVSKAEDIQRLFAETKKAFGK